MSELEVIEGQVVNTSLSPATDIAGAVARYEELNHFVKKVLRADVDYGVIPGTGTKPTLLKPGAEKLVHFFGLTALFNLVDRVEDWDGGFFFFRYECRLTHRATGLFIGNGFGSANSMEKKYRWRKIPSFKATEDDITKAVHAEERTSSRGTYTMYTVPNSEIYDLVNTLDKMSQKRSMVAAVLVSTGASALFTQDVEDMPQFVDREASKPTSKPTSKPASKPASKPTRKPASKAKRPANWGSQTDLLQALERELNLSIKSIMAALGASDLDAATATLDEAILFLTGGAPKVAVSAEAKAIAAEVSANDLDGSPDELAYAWLAELQADVEALGKQRTGKASTKQINFAASLLNKAWPLTKDSTALNGLRHTFLFLVNGKASSKNWNSGELSALIDRIKDEYELNDLAAAHIPALVLDAESKAGQGELFLEGGIMDHWDCPACGCTERKRGETVEDDPDWDWATCADCGHPAGHIPAEAEGYDHHHPSLTAAERNV